MDKKGLLVFSFTAIEKTLDILLFTVQGRPRIACRTQLGHSTVIFLSPLSQSWVEKRKTVYIKREENVLADCVNTRLGPALLNHRH